MFKLRKKRSGFTLVELLVVLVIIGIIVAIILPNTLRAIDQAERRETAGILRAITNAAYLCYSQTRNWASCDTLGELTASPNRYLDSGVNVATTYSGGSGSGAWGLVGSVASGYQANYTVHFPSWPNLN